MNRGTLLVCLILLPCLSAVADIILADGRISFGGFVRGRAEYWRYIQEAGSSSFTFKKGLSLIWLSARLSDELGIGMLFDAGRPAPVDLFATVQWPNGWMFRAGQFKLPLSFETDMRPDRLKLFDYSLAAPIIKPAGTRDIGGLVGWRRERIELSLAVVNGSGPNSEDANRWKDICGRIVGRPLAGLTVGGAAYYGRTETEGATWLSGLVDALWENGKLRLQAMGLYHRHKDERSLSNNVQLSHRFDWLEPVGRFDVTFRDHQVEIMPILGLNFLVSEERFRVSADYQYHRHFGGRGIKPWLYQQIALTIQAGI